MHELLLHTTVPSARHHQVLSILAGIAAMQPVAIHEKHLVFKPLQQPAGPGRPDPSQGTGSQMKPLQGQMHGDLFYLKVVGEIGGEEDTGVQDRSEKDGAKVSVEEIKDEGKADGTDSVRSAPFLLSCVGSEEYPLHSTFVFSKLTALCCKAQRQQPRSRTNKLDAPIPRPPGPIRATPSDLPRHGRYPNHSRGPHEIHEGNGVYVRPVLLFDCFPPPLALFLHPRSLSTVNKSHTQIIDIRLASSQPTTSTATA